MAGARASQTTTLIARASSMPTRVIIWVKPSVPPDAEWATTGKAYATEPLARAAYKKMWYKDPKAQVHYQHVTCDAPEEN